MLLSPSVEPFTVGPGLKVPSSFRLIQPPYSRFSATDFGLYSRIWATAASSAVSYFFGSALSAPSQDAHFLLFCFAPPFAAFSGVAPIRRSRTHGGRLKSPHFGSLASSSLR